jgi:hypothetical protein
MRVNIYAEEMTQRFDIIEKEIDGEIFTGVRLYLYLPVTQQDGTGNPKQIRGPFMHDEKDDDSAAVTFWGKRALRELLGHVVKALDEHSAIMGDE